LSSRNIFLGTEERPRAPTFYQALLAGRRAIEGGATKPDSVDAVMRKILAGEPAIRIDYLAICDAETLEPLDKIDRQTVILGAIRLGAVRLIDNVLAKAKRNSRRH
jgi:pantoate--beta-alanine ligase